MYEARVFDVTCANVTHIRVTYPLQYTLVIISSGTFANCIPPPHLHPSPRPRIVQDDISKFSVGDYVFYRRILLSFCCKTMQILVCHFNAMTASKGKQWFLRHRTRQLGSRDMTTIYYCMFCNVVTLVR